jgi:hypothetical protein
MSMAKKIQISLDDTTYYTLPGNKGDMTREGGSLKDTIFGQDFDSNQTGLIAWGITADGLYKGYAGYVAKIMKSGSTTAMTDEAMTLVSGKTYKITDATKNLFDRTVVPTFEDGGSAINASDIESINYLFGQVTLKSSYTPTGAITVATGSYLPRTVLGKGQSFTLTQTAATKDTTDFPTAQGNGGYRTFESGLKTVQLNIKGVYDSSVGLEALLESRAELVIEVNPDGAGKSTARGIFKPMSTGQSGNVGELEDSDVTFSLSVPDQADLVAPFSWLHASDTTLNQAIRSALTLWEGGSVGYFKYMADGTNGFKGQGVLTDLTLTGGLEAMNDFAIKVQGSGAPTEVP